MLIPVLGLCFELDFYAFYVSHESFIRLIKVSLLAACPVSAEFFVLPWVLRSSGEYPGITFLPWAGAGFGVCCLHSSFLVGICLPGVWAEGWGEFIQSHGLSSGLKHNLVLMGGRSGILALLAHGFPGENQQKS